MSTGQLLESLASVDSMIPAFKYPRKPHVLNHLTVLMGVPIVFMLLAINTVS
jgi:hypothetical protein